MLNKLHGFKFYLYKEQKQRISTDGIKINPCTTDHYCSIVHGFIAFSVILFLLCSPARSTPHRISVYPNRKPPARWLPPQW